MSSIITSYSPTSLNQQIVFLYLDYTYDQGICYLLSINSTTGNSVYQGLGGWERYHQAFFAFARISHFIDH